MNQIFGLDGPVFKGMNELTVLVALNFLTLLFSIPIVTAGAAITSMHYIIIQHREGTEGKILPTYWKQFKGNLKTATPVWMLFLAAGFFIFMDYLIITQSSAIPDFFIIPISVAGVLIASVAAFAFPLMAKFENTLRATLKNAALLAVANFPKTVTILVIHLGCLFLFTQVTRLMPIAFLMGISLPADLSSLLYWPVLRSLIPEDERF